MIIHHNGAGLVDQSWFPARVHDGSGYRTPSKWLIIWFLNRGPILTTYPHRPGMISSKKINQHQLPTSRSCCPTEVQSLLVSPCLPSNASAWAALWRDPPKVWLKVLHQQSDGWSTYPPSTNPYQKVGPKWFSLDKAALKKPLFLLGEAVEGGVDWLMWKSNLSKSDPTRWGRDGWILGLFFVLLPSVPMHFNKYEVWSIRLFSGRLIRLGSTYCSSLFRVHYQKESGLSNRNEERLHFLHVYTSNV